MNTATVRILVRIVSILGSACKLLKYDNTSHLVNGEVSGHVVVGYSNGVTLSVLVGEGINGLPRYSAVGDGEISVEVGVKFDGKFIKLDRNQTDEVSAYVPLSELSGLADKARKFSSVTVTDSKGTRRYAPDNKYYGDVCLFIVNAIAQWDNHAETTKADYAAWKASNIDNCFIMVPAKVIKGQPKGRPVRKLRSLSTGYDYQEFGNGVDGLDNDGAVYDLEKSLTELDAMNIRIRFELTRVQKTAEGKMKASQDGRLKGWFSYAEHWATCGAAKSKLWHVFHAIRKNRALIVGELRARLADTNPTNTTYFTSDTHPDGDVSQGESVHEATDMDNDVHGAFASCHRGNWWQASKSSKANKAIEAGTVIRRRKTVCSDMTPLVVECFPEGNVTTFRGETMSPVVLFDLDYDALVEMLTA